MRHKGGNAMMLPLVAWRRCAPTRVRGLSDPGRRCPPLAGPRPGFV